MCPQGAFQLPLTSTLFCRPTPTTTQQVKTFKMARKAPFSELRRLVADEMGVPLDRQRFWKWASRQNQTYRPAQVGVLHMVLGWPGPPNQYRWVNCVLLWARPAQVGCTVYWAGARASAQTRPTAPPRWAGRCVLGWRPLHAWLCGDAGVCLCEGVRVCLLPS